MFMPMYTCVQWPVLLEWPIARCPRLQLRLLASWWQNRVRTVPPPVVKKERKEWCKGAFIIFRHPAGGQSDF